MLSRPLAGAGSLVVELGVDAEPGQRRASLLDALGAGDRAGKRQRVGRGCEGIEEEGERAHGPELHPAAAIADEGLAGLPPRAANYLEARLGRDHGGGGLEL